MGILGNYLPNWLPEDPNQNAAARQGLLAFGAGLLGGRGDLGGILGDGLMAGTQTYNGALAQQQQAALRTAQMQQMSIENKQREAAIARPGQIAASIARARQGGMASGSSTNAPQPVTPLDKVPRIGDSVHQTAPQPAAPGQQASQPNEDLFSYHYANAKQLAADGFAAEADKEFDNAIKLRPEVREVVEMQFGDKRVMVQLFKDGRPPQVLDGFAPKAEKLHFANTGGATVGLDSFTGKQISTVANSVTPDAKLGADTTMRGQNMTDKRAREANAINRQGQQSQIINDPTQGPIVVDKGTGQARQVTLNGKAVPGEAVTKRETAGKNLVPLLKEGAGLIDGATGSYWGTAMDHGARLFGGATGGAQNIAKLKVLEGNIMMAQPRMEGPQSNLDVELYRQMAAQIGDPTVPNSTKKAALQTVYALYEKYDPDAGKEGNPFTPQVNQDTPPPAGSGKPKIKSAQQILQEQKSRIAPGWTVKEK